MGVSRVSQVPLAVSSDIVFSPFPPTAPAPATRRSPLLMAKGALCVRRENPNTEPTVLHNPAAYDSRSPSRSHSNDHSESPTYRPNTPWQASIAAPSPPHTISHILRRCTAPRCSRFVQAPTHTSHSISKHSSNALETPSYEPTHAAP